MHIVIDVLVGSSCGLIGLGVGRHLFDQTPRPMPFTADWRAVRASGLTPSEWLQKHGGQP